MPANCLHALFCWAKPCTHITLSTDISQQRWHHHLDNCLPLPLQQKGTSHSVVTLSVRVPLSCCSTSSVISLYKRLIWAAGPAASLRAHAASWGPFRAGGWRWGANMLENHTESSVLTQDSQVKSGLLKPAAFSPLGPPPLLTSVLLWGIMWMLWVSCVCQCLLKG